MQTLLPTPPRSPRIILSSDKNTTQELTDDVPLPTTTTSKDPKSKRSISSKYSHIPGALRRMCRRQVHPTTTTSTKQISSADLQHQLYLKMKRSLQHQANDQALWEVLKRKFKKSFTFNTSCRDDDIHSHHDDHQEDDAPLVG
ncbi:hypothetical protein Tco_0112595 [Tanacetum coccineum]